MATNAAYQVFKDSYGILSQSPKSQGLYDPRNEHENCGIGLIVVMKGRKSHTIVKGALEICVNLDHRGGCGCDPITGDGAGIFIQLPHNFSRRSAKRSGIRSSAEGDYGVGFVFLSKNDEERRLRRQLLKRLLRRKASMLEALARRACPQSVKF